MKKIILGILGGLLALTAITSCKKLDLKPYNAIDIETGFQNVIDAKYWNSGMYTALRSRSYGVYVTLQEQMSDQVNASGDFGNRGGNVHRWGTFLQADDLSGPYSAYYSGLANVNVMIKGFETIKTSTTAETDSLNTFKADARMMRAYYLHQLVLRYSKAYNPATAATDLGVPLVTEFNILLKPDRSTVKAVYDQIIADINVAKSLNTKRINHKGARYFTPDAVLAFEARVRLCMQDYKGAYAAANTLITSGRYPLYNTVASLSTYWRNDAYQEDIFRIVATLTETTNNNGNIYLGQSTSIAPTPNVYVPDFIPTQAVVDSYDAVLDIRKPVYFEQKTIQIQGVKYNNIWLISKFFGNPALITSAPYTSYQQANKIFRIGEVYTIAAEAAFGDSNEPNARTAINALRVARGLVGFISTGTALRDDIRNERSRELNFEGFRIFDLKRWGLGFTRGTPQNTAFIQTSTGFNSLVVAANDQKFTWGIPTNDLLLNTNLTPNPGW